MYLKTSALTLSFISFATVVSAGGYVARVPQEVTLKKDGDVVAMRSGLVWKGHTNTHGKEGKFSVESISNLEINGEDFTAEFKVNGVKDFEMSTTLTPLGRLGADDKCAVESQNALVRCTYELHKGNTTEANNDPQQRIPLKK